MKKAKRATPVRTKRPMLHKSFLLTREDRELWRAAASKLGESQAEFLRLALRERGRRIMLEDRAA